MSCVPPVKSCNISKTIFTYNIFYIGHVSLHLMLHAEHYYILYIYIYILKNFLYFAKNISSYLFVFLDRIFKKTRKDKTTILYLILCILVSLIIVMHTVRTYMYICSAQYVVHSITLL